jgi:hypothetical protein
LKLSTSVCSDQDLTMVSIDESPVPKDEKDPFYTREYDIRLE